MNKTKYLPHRCCVQSSASFSGAVLRSPCRTIGLRERFRVITSQAAGVELRENVSSAIGSIARTAGTGAN